MPIDLKIRYDNPGTGEIFMRRCVIGTDKGVSEMPFESMPVTELVLHMLPGEISTVTATFVVWNQEDLLRMVELADPKVFTTYCFFCHEKLERREDPLGEVYWLCGCKATTPRSQEEE